MLGVVTWLLTHVVLNELVTDSGATQHISAYKDIFLHYLMIVFT